jgi:hypothetical protein
MYVEGSCELSYKPFYHPIEAAIRWCGLLDYETEILHAFALAPHTLSTAFPQWPCLYLNLEKLHDAVANGELRFGSLGVPVEPGIHVPPELLTVRYIDLKEWMTQHFPDQKPAFLFDQIERAVHPAISTDSFQVLQADRDALRVQLNALETIQQTEREAHAQVVTQRDRLLRAIGDGSTLNERSLRGHECVLGAVLQVVLGRSPAGKPYSVFNSQEALVSAIVAHSGSVTGISKHSLDLKFAAAKRRLKDA